MQKGLVSSKILALIIIIIYYGISTIGGWWHCIAKCDIIQTMHNNNIIIDDLFMFVIITTVSYSCGSNARLSNKGGCV